MENVDAVYLDHAGTTLPRPDVVQICADEIKSGQFVGNPHSALNGGRLSDAIDSIRSHVLQFFGTDEVSYDIIFTASSTASLKLIGESFPWSSDSTFCYPANSHTSVVGVRTYAPNAVCCHSSVLQTIKSETDVRRGDDEHADTYHLMAVPGECNMTGVKVNLEAVSCLLEKENVLNEVQKLGGYSVISDSSSRSSNSSSSSSTKLSSSKWLWMLDASKLASSSAINLKELSVNKQPHFVCLSFYKIFGYPTGVGALLVNRSISHLLQKRY